jgi:hypothetical protein
VHGISTFFNEVLDELELFNDKKVIFEEKKCPLVRRLSANFVIRISFFSFNLDISTFQLRFSELLVFIGFWVEPASFVE